MYDTLMEQIVQTVNGAVEERAQRFGPYYASSLEGYGDVCRQNVGMLEAVKEVKKAVSDLVGYINLANPQELYTELAKLQGRCHNLAYEAMRMCETVKRYERTIKDKVGGDLTDLIDQFNRLDEPEEENDE